MLNIIAKFLKILNSEAQPGQISLALAFSMIVGFTPLFSLHNLIVVFLVLLIRTNLTAFLLGLSVFSGLAYLLDPLFHGVGHTLLTSDSLNGLWTSLYNSTLWRLEHFNNTIVMGSVVISLFLFIPFILLANFIIVKYRVCILQWVDKLRFVQLIKGTKLFSLYKSLSGVSGS